MIGLLILAIISVAAILLGLTAPHEGIEETDQPPAVSQSGAGVPALAGSYGSSRLKPELQPRRTSNGVACVRVQRTNEQHLNRSLTRSAPT